MQTNGVALCVHSFGDINFAKSGEDGIEDFLDVFHNDEETCIVAIYFDASAKGRLGVDGEFVGVL